MQETLPSQICFNVILCMNYRVLFTGRLIIFLLFRFRKPNLILMAFCIDEQVTGRTEMWPLASGYSTLSVPADFLLLFQLSATPLHPPHLFSFPSSSQSPPHTQRRLLLCQSQLSLCKSLFKEMGEMLYCYIITYTITYMLY